jgi:hypothetical protein
MVRVKEVGIKTMKNNTGRIWSVALLAGTFLCVATGVASAADFSSWQKKMKVIFTGYNPPGGATTLTNFPALVVLSTNISGFNYGDFQSLTNQDLRFTAADGISELNYEIESWNTNGSSCVWLQVTNLVDTNTSVWAYWGKSDTNAPAYTTNGATWSAGYGGVWHMKEGVATTVTESASTNSGTLYNTPAWTNGLVNGALAFNGTNQYASMGNGAGLRPPFPFTISAVAQTKRTTNVTVVADCATNNNAQYSGFSVYLNADGSISAQTGNNVANNSSAYRNTAQTATNLVSSNAWHNVTVVYNSISSFQIYLDGFLQTNASTSGTGGSLAYDAINNQFRLGAMYDASGGFNNTRYYNNLIDDVQLSSVARSSNWVWASYMNMASNTAVAGLYSFNTYGAAQPVHSSLPQISNVGSQNRSNTSADLVGRLITNGASAATVSLYWSTTDGSNNASAWGGGSVSDLGNRADGATFTNTLAGLTPNTTYYWNYSAANVSGTVWGATTVSPSFKTYGPPGVNNGAGATGIDAIGATLSGTLTNGVAARVYLLRGSQDGVWSVTNDLGTLNEGAFSNAVSGLTPGTTNYYTCYATNDYGSALASPAVCFTTLQSVANTWTGLGASSNASEAANWSGGVPTRSSTIVLDSTTNKPMIWNAGSNGLPDTVVAWRQSAAYTGTVTFLTCYPGQGAFTNFTIVGDCVLSNGVWTHLANTGGETNRLRVTVGGNLWISNTTITADALGYSAGNGLAPGSSVPVPYSGGSYGGAGYSNPKTYGSIVAPVNLGSGGYGTSASGGGAIMLTVAGTTTVASAGTLSANGASNGGGQSAGAGGSVCLTTGWLTGNGTLRANGGDNNWNNGGSGGGGRVAIILTGSGADLGLWNGTNAAYGGPGSAGPPAGAGTVYRRTAAGVDTLIVDNNGVTTFSLNWTLMPPAPNAVNLNSFSNVVIRNKGVLGVRGDTTLDFTTFAPTSYGPNQSYLAIDSDTNVTYPGNWTVDNYTLIANNITTSRLVNMTIGTNGVLSHYQNTTNEVYRLNLTLSGNLTVLSNGMITADTLGYSAGNGPGYLSDYGAAYGGGASTGHNGSAVNPNTYGSIMAPTNLGSGGPSYGATVPGGGALVLTVAGTTTVVSAGMISANGKSSNYGAAGGSIYLRTGWLTGGGTLRANGGDSSWGFGASGGGGRVALVLTGAGADFSSWTGTNAAYSGTASGGASASAAGTVYRQTAGAGAGAGTVIVDNGGAATNGTFTSLPAFSSSTEKISQTVWVTTNKARIGLVTNAAIAGLTLNTNGVLELSGYTLTVRSLTVTNKSYRGGTYGPHDTPVSLLTDAGSNGKVVVYVAGGTAYVFR